MAYSEKKRRRRSREGERDSRKYPPSALCPGKSAVDGGAVSALRAGSLEGGRWEPERASTAAVEKETKGKMRSRLVELGRSG